MTEKKLQAKTKYAGLKPEEPLVFDRTVDDVVERTKKGYYNLGDLQRIQAWIRYGVEMAEETFAEIPFTEGEAVTRERFERALNDINGLIQKIYEGHDKTPPTMPIAIAWDWKKANEAEKILQLATDFLYSSWNDSIFATATYGDWEERGYPYYHPQFLSPMHVFPREKPEEKPKRTCTFVLVSLSGKEVQYEVELNSWFLLPPYESIFPNDGTIDEWNEQERGKRRLDMGYVFVKGPDWGDGNGQYFEGGTFYFYAINRAMVQKALTDCTFELAEDGSHITVSGIPEIIQRQFSCTGYGNFEYRGFCVKFFRAQYNGKWRGEQRDNVTKIDLNDSYLRKKRTTFRRTLDKEGAPKPNGHGEVVYSDPKRCYYGTSVIYDGWANTKCKYDFFDELDVDIRLDGNDIYSYVRYWLTRRKWVHNRPRKWTVGWQLMTGDGRRMGIMGAKREIKIEI